MTFNSWRKHLLIPDAHAEPHTNLRRFDWLGELILEEMPDVIIDIGDWWDMPSLSSYDKGNKSFEGRRYKADIEAGHEADRRCFGRIERYNNTRSRLKKRQYNPLVIRTTGNHEQRIARAVERQAELEGVIGLSDLNPRFSGVDVEVLPFLVPRVVDDIAYCHYFVSGVMGRAVPSAAALLSKHHMSCSAGHQHSRDWSEGIRADGIRMQALICGSFHDIDHTSTYSDTQSSSRWWDGVHIKNGVYKGNYDRTEISIERLKYMMEG